MSKRQSTDLHLVISTRELQEPTVLQLWYEKHKYIDSYLITVESGKTGHKHIESFVQFKKEIRTDKLKESICTLFKISDYIEKKNVKVTVNSIDPDPMYGYGYSLKENPEIVLTNIKDNTYFDKCKAYYQAHEEEVNELKMELKSKYTNKQMTFDSIAEDYYQYLIKCEVETVYHYDSHEFEPIIGGPTIVQRKMPLSYFNKFFIASDALIPFSLYQRLNLEKLNEYVDMRLQKKGTSS